MRTGAGIRWSWVGLPLKLLLDQDSKSMFEVSAGYDWSGALEHVSTALSLKQHNVSPDPLTAQSEQQEHRIISPFSGATAQSPPLQLCSVDSIVQGHL